MYSQSTKALAISILLASTPVQGAAHLRPQPNGNVQLEARAPINWNDFLGQLSSLFGGFTLPALPTPTPSSSKVAAVTTTSAGTSNVKTSSSLAKSTSSAVSTAKVSSTVSSAATTKSASASVITSVKTSSTLTSTSSKPTAVITPSSSSKSTSTVVPSSTSKSASVVVPSSASKSASVTVPVSSGKSASVATPSTSSRSASAVTPPASSKSASVVGPSASSKSASIAIPSSSSRSTSVVASASSSAAKSSSTTISSSTVAPVLSSTSTGTTVVARPSSTVSLPSISGSACPIPRISRGSSAFKSSTKAASSTAVTTTSSATSAPVVTSSSIIPSSTISLNGPSVTISNGVVVGSSLPGGVEQYLGIPYAQPPVGQLRLKPPVAYTGSFGTLNATVAPPSCPQFAQAVTGNYSAGGIEPLIDEFVFTRTVEQEDCLTMSIFRPNNTTPNSKLPVVYWIYGGGFQFGATSMYNGSALVARSVKLGAPIIFVEVNYRLGGFGFLAGADLAGEVSTNLGLRDQRLGLQWTADNIAAFGGDSSKVTLWGESAGALSATFQTVINGGDNTYKGQALFRATIQNSGAFAPADPVTAPQAQTIYDFVVANTGCSRSTAADRLACLRSVDFQTLRNATNSVPGGFGSYRSADLPYLPRPDPGDNFFPQTAEIALASGKWSKTPAISGNQKDEGTILAITQNNITTNDQLVDYLASWFPNNQNAQSDVRSLAALYADNATAGQPDGSPYDTGSDNNVYPQYKRLAAILGDIVFIITRRAYLNLATGQGVKAYSYLSSYLQGLPTYGTLHGSDFGYLYDPIFAEFNPTRSIQTYYISFINYLDPNVISSPDTTLNWPVYSQNAPVLVEFTGSSPRYLNDTFRAPVYEFLLAHVLGLRV